MQIIVDIPSNNMPHIVVDGVTGNHYQAQHFCHAAFLKA